MARNDRSPSLSPGEAPRAPRLLFLDDDPGRAEVFLADFPDAVWVQTAAECIARLAETWDEVHLDHDLGGEHFVDLSREDCGMEVVRWLSLGVHPHLRRTRFFIHSHNANAATMMGMQLMVSGFKVEVRPFGAPPSASQSLDEVEPSPSFLSIFLAWLVKLLRGRPREDYGYVASRDAPPRPGDPPMEPFDFNWTPPAVANRDINAGSGSEEKGTRPPSA